MSFEKAIPLGLAGEKLSRTITGTDEVCIGRSVVATGCGAALGAGAAGIVTVGASAAGLSALAAATAPVTVPLAVATGAVALIRSLFD